MFFEVLQAVAGVFVLMAFWLGVQQYIRKGSKLDPDTDVLDHVTHGCGSCHNSECCSGEKKQERQERGTALPGSEVIQITPGKRQEHL